MQRQLVYLTLLSISACQPPSLDADTEKWLKFNRFSQAAQCAYLINDNKPAISIDEIKRLLESPQGEEKCGYLKPDVAGDDDAISYATIDEHRVRLCAVFDRPSTEWSTRDIVIISEWMHPETVPPESAGHYCASIDMSRAVAQ